MDSLTAFQLVVIGCIFLCILADEYLAVLLLSIALVAPDQIQDHIKETPLCVVPNPVQGHIIEPSEGA